MSWLDWFLATPAPPPASGPQNQQDALALVHAAATGQTPSAADAELKAQTARNVAGAYALANTVRSRTPAAAARLAVQGADQANAQATEQGVAQRAQEQQVAQQQYLAGTSAARQGDIAQEGIDQQVAQSKNAFLGGLVGGLGSAGIAAVSDERAKKDVRDGTDSIEVLLDALSPKKWDGYKDPNDGRAVGGIVAQDAEKGGPIGRAMVQEGPGGKLQLDPAASISAALAAVADLHERLKRVEAK